MRDWACAFYILLLAAMLASLGATCARAAGTAADYASVRKEFRQAYARSAADSSDVADSESLKSYPLYPYLQAARIRKALRANTPASVLADARAAEFVAAHEPMPVANLLRRAWLDSLARRLQWSLFLEAYRDADARIAARCQSFEARIALDRTDGLVGDISKEWLAPRSEPHCKRPFEWMRENGVLTTELIDRRARLALQNGEARFARQMIELLPAERAAPLSQWSAMLENPRRGIDASIASPEADVDQVVLLAGWSRLARADAAAAKARFEKLVHARVLSVDDASPFALSLALRLAWNRDADALGYFELAAPGKLDETAREWWVRAALWSGDWNQAARTIGGLSEPRRQSARWRYWAARAAEQLGQTEKAQQSYELLLEDDNYYSAMAAGRLQRSVAPHARVLPADSERLATLERQPAFERARELLLCGMRHQAAAEWQFGYQSLSDEERSQSIHLATRWGWHDRAIATATAQRVFTDYELLYPRPFSDAVSNAARRAQLPREIIYGVVRQESLYRSDAVSSAGARGLMQLLPETARHTAQRLNLPNPTQADLFDPSVNTSLGAAYLRSLLDQFEGQLPVALAGYNAGPNAAQRWLPRQPLDADIWIENIPYNETREYVQRVLWHNLLFTWLDEGGRAQPTQSWITSIRAPRSAEPSVRVADRE